MFPTFSLASLISSKTVFNSDISWMRAFGIFDQLTSEWIPLTASEKFVTRDREEEAAKLRELYVEEFFGALMFYMTGIALATVVGVLELSRS